MARTVHGCGQENWRIQGYDNDEHPRKAKMGEICGKLDTAQPPLPLRLSLHYQFIPEITRFPDHRFPRKNQVAPAISKTRFFLLLSYKKTINTSRRLLLFCVTPSAAPPFPFAPLQTNLSPRYVLLGIAGELRPYGSYDPLRQRETNAFRRDPSPRTRSEGRVGGGGGGLRSRRTI